uniref:Uncharacterized protein n=1 Tax=Trichogramma kaykai TaxID=54128 RepID=A0ABD2XP68_9HYME
MGSLKHVGKTDISVELYDKFSSSPSEVKKNKLPVNHSKQKKLELLKILIENTNWKVNKERRRFLEQFHFLIQNWLGKLPDLRDYFQQKEIDLLLSDCISYCDEDDNYQGKLIIKFVARSGYTDEPDVDENDKLLSRRTTPIHHAARKENFYHMEEFFKIYNRLDVNYTDEFGFTHFHAACMSGNKEIVKKFLKLGWSPNYHEKNSSDPPLHLAIKHEHKEVIELLLRSGADQNLANTQGSRPLHIICQMQGHNHLVDIFFKINHDLNNTLEFDAQDDLGNTPLHLALYYDNKKEVELLLRRGANPNLANDNGLTPLHIISRRREGNIDDNGLVRLFFKINDERKQKVQVNDVDKFGRTPLQLAVANVFPHVVDLILNHGADLDSFVFPKERHFAKRLEPGFYENCQDFKLRKASGILIIVERLEKKGFILDRINALTIIKLFTRLGLFEKISVLDEHWYKDEEFARKAKKIMVNRSLSLYKVVRSRPEDVEKRLIYEDFFAFARANNYCFIPERYHKICTAHLSKILLKRFSQRWALDCLVGANELLKDDQEWTRKSLWNICMSLEVSGQISG